MKYIFLFGLLIIFSCDTIRPASDQLMLERQNVFIKRKTQFNECIKKKIYSITFKAKFDKSKTGFSGIFDNDPKLVVKDINKIHFLKTELTNKELNCLKKVVGSLELKVRDSRLSHEYFEIKIMKDVDKFNVNIQKMDEQDF